jgi:hypothetical protein
MKAYGHTTSGGNHTQTGHFFKRAPGFFDVTISDSVYTTGLVYHNLTVPPEFMIEKTRTTTTTNWRVFHKDVASGGALNLSDSFDKALYPRNPTTTTVEYGNNNAVLYLFATLAGISKVGSYTGNGTGQAIACGFGSGGARFVLIKRTDAAGGWYTYDSARGLTSGSSPYLLLNSTAAEVTGNNGVYASSGGFTLGATAITTTNIASATYIFLAVA